MKYPLTLWLCLLYITSHTQWKENFQSGLDTNWIGDRSDFIVNANQQLQLSAPMGGMSALLHSFNNSDSLIWIFYFKMNFAPSASNRMNILLMTDKLNQDSANAYVLEIGENGNNDNWKFYVKQLQSKILFAEGELTKLAGDPAEARMKIKKNADESWAFSIDYSGNSQFVLERTIQTVPNLNISSPLFGLQCFYSDTRTDKFFMDDISINDVVNPDQALQPSSLEVLITEIMADPTPVVGLPEKEFVELKNTSNKKLDLSDCILTDGSTECKLPKYIFDPNTYLILCNSKDTQQFRVFGKFLGLGSFPSLNNAGDLVSFRNKNHEIIHEINYDDSWYRSSIKKEGGYSLEMINTGNPCSGNGNWIASNHFSGGTPGAENSVAAYQKDVSGPKIQDVYPLNDFEIKLIFNEKIQSIAAPDITISPSHSIASIDLLSPSDNELLLVLDEAIEKGIQYKLTLQDIADCLGNTSNLESNLFALPEEPSYRDLVWSEVLFNPYSGGSDFVELYNRSNKVLSLNNLMIKNSIQGDNWYPVNSEKIILPHSYLALTLEPEIILRTYKKNDSSKIIKTQIPMLDDDGGNLQLAYTKNNTLLMLDSFTFTKDWHLVFIHDVEGVSLEKIDMESPSDNRSNWQSAAASSGYATPGLANSHFIDTALAKQDKPYLLSSQIISPNGDTYRDFLSISFNLKKSGYKSRIEIYDLSGQKLKSISYQVLSNQDLIVWDGDDDLGSIVPVGNYILYIELLHPDGDKLKFKERLVVDH